MDAGPDSFYFQTLTKYSLRPVNPWALQVPEAMMLSRLLVRSDILRFGAIAAVGLTFALGRLVFDMQVVWSSFAAAFLCSGALMATGMTYRGLGRDAGVAAACMATGQIVLFSSFVALYNYLGLALHRPLFDDAISSLDKALGFDWLAYVNFVKSDPVIASILSTAYASTLPQLAGAIVFLGFTKQFARLDELTLAFMIGAVATISIWIAFPSLGEMQYRYAMGAPSLPYQLAISREESLQVFALWQNGASVVRGDEMLGLIGAPSFHTVMALLTLRAFWGLPWIGPLAIVINALVLIAVPADGGHHFFDMAAGAAVAAASAFLARRLLTRTVEPVYSVMPAPALAG